MKRLTNSIAWAVIAAPLLLFALSSCRSTLEPDPSGGDDGILSPDVTTLKLSFGDGPSGDDPESKVMIRSTTGKFLWSKDDRVAVWFAADPENPAGGAWAVSSEVKAEEQVDVSGDGIRCAVAIYPPESAVAGSYTTINYPTSYNLAGKADEYVPVPMVAKNDANKAGLRFYHAGALLRFRIYAVPETTEKLVVSFTDKDGAPLAVTGEFAFSAAAGDSFATTGPVGATAGRNTVTFNLTGTTGGLSADTDNLVINVPVPVSTIGGFEIKAYKNDGSTSTIPASDVITQRQLGNAWAWDAHRALGLDKAVCFGYNPPENPIIGATDASHVFSVGPNKKVYIARADLGYFGESFPDTPWRLMEQQWDVMPDTYTKNGDFSFFSPGSSGYVPPSHSNWTIDPFMPWNNSQGIFSQMQSINSYDVLDDLVVGSTEVASMSTKGVVTANVTDPGNNKYVVDDVTYEDVIFASHIWDRSKWDWGVYNSKFGNSANPDPTGLWTYEGEDMNDAEWRVPTFEELSYLMGFPIGYGVTKLLTNFPISELYISYSSDYNRRYDKISNFEGDITPGGLFYFDNISYTWKTRGEVNVGEEFFTGEWVYNYHSDANQLTSAGQIARRNSEGRPLFTYITILDSDTGKRSNFFALLPDNWGTSDNPDPGKNMIGDGSLHLLPKVESMIDNSSFSDQVYLDLASKNVFTKERWHFFMEPSGIVLLDEKKNYYVGSLFYRSPGWPFAESTDYSPIINTTKPFRVVTATLFPSYFLTLWGIMSLNNDNDPTQKSRVRLFREVPNTP